MTQTLTRNDLYSLEDYHLKRPQLRSEVLEHKARRQVFIGPHASLYFEDRLTIQYQIQEMLRIERIFESAAIEEELAAYNPLIPDGDNLKATFMLEYEDVDERREALAQMGGIEDRVWVQIGDRARVFAVADEDLDRTSESKTSAVHFLRFQFEPYMIAGARAGEPMSFGIDHQSYQHEVNPVAEQTQSALVADFS